MTENHQDVCLFEINQHRTWLYIMMMGYKKYGPEQCQRTECMMWTQFGVKWGKERKTLKTIADREAMIYMLVAH
jgi:hypothetical protein